MEPKEQNPDQMTEVVLQPTQPKLVRSGPKLSGANNSFRIMAVVTVAALVDLTLKDKSCNFRVFSFYLFSSTLH